jgi:opacity protein-like surface antigen
MQHRNASSVRAAVFLFSAALAAISGSAIAAAAATTHAQTPTPTPATTGGTSTVFLKVLEAQMSTIMQEDQSSFSGLGLRARLGSPLLIPQIEFVPGIEYWRNKAHLNPYDIEGTRKDATLALDVRYNFGGSAFRPYLGAGLGIHFLSSEVDAPAFGLNDESDSLIKGGAAFLGGVDFPITEKINNFLDVKYHHLSDYRQLKINWGIGFAF